jgi:hypothetical protein
MPSAVDQINAVFNAWLPFILAVIFVGAVMWRALAWRFNAVMEKRKELYDLLATEAQLATQAAARREAELKATLDQQAEQIKVLEAKKDKMPAEVQPAIADLVTSSNTAITQMGQLVNANNHTTEAVRSFSIVGINVDRKR